MAKAIVKARYKIRIVFVAAGPNYPYDYQTNTWDGSYQQLNTSTYYDAQKHAYLQPGTAGAFEWNVRDNSGALLCLERRVFSCASPQTGTLGVNHPSGYGHEGSSTAGYGVALSMAHFGCFA